MQVLPRRLRDKILATEFGQNWRKIRWWARQFTTTSTTILCSVLGVAGTWIVNQAHKIDNQGTRILVLETQIVPDLKLAERVGSVERAVSKLEGAVGQFDYPTVKQELEKPLTLHGRPMEPRVIQPAKLTPAKERPKR